jgi:rhodanese-related sulfurtransferase
MMPNAVPSIDPREAAAAAGEAAANAGSGSDSAAALVVDVREPDEFAAVRVPGAVLVPISQFVARHAELPKDRPLLMLCAAGSRSSSATMYLLQNGWTDVRNITGGIGAWQQAGLPVRSGAPGPGEGDLPA